jgi:hypothetical protein
LPPGQPVNLDINGDDRIDEFDLLIWCELMCGGEADFDILLLFSQQWRVSGSG